MCCSVWGPEAGRCNSGTKNWYGGKMGLGTTQKDAKPDLDKCGRSCRIREAELKCCGDGCMEVRAMKLRVCTRRKQGSEEGEWSASTGEG